MRATDLLIIVGVSVGCAVAVGLIGLAVARLIRHRSWQWTLLVVATVATGGTCFGSLAVAYLMFLSPHDLEVAVVVSSASGAAAVAVARYVGRRTAAWSRSIGAQLRTLDPDMPGELRADGPMELRLLSSECAAAQRRLTRARLREARLEASRRELVSWVSHDLRTPLAGLRALTEALEDGITVDTDGIRQQIRMQVDRMAGMVDDLFDLSRIHAGVLHLSPEPVAVHDLVSEAVAGAAPIAQSRDVRICGHVDTGLELFADPDGLSRVVANLIVNAIHHTPAGGTVEIHGRSVPDGIELSVSDGCGGLDVLDMERVFEVGWQGGAARPPAGTTPTQGAGLGLAIVKGIVEAHRGRVQVENLGTAAGCRFLVTLPA